MSSIAQGAIQGAGVGSAFGPWGALAGGVGGAALAGLTGRRKNTDIQDKQRELVDQLLSGISGEGPYANLFNMDEEAFQKSYVDPAKSTFQNQIAPQIQQASIFSGQQRGTGLDDQLLRAGVDLDQILNQQYASMQQQAQRNRLGGIDTILGSNAPGESQGFGEAALQGLSGYAGTGDFRDQLSMVLNTFKKQPQNQEKTPAGFTS